MYDQTVTKVYDSFEDDVLLISEIKKALIIKFCTIK